MSSSYVDSLEANHSMLGSSASAIKPWSTEQKTWADSAEITNSQSAEGVKRESSHESPPSSFEPSTPPSRFDRPKSAWKSKDRRPRFTDDLIMGDSPDVEAEIETLVLDNEDDDSRSGPHKSSLVGKAIGSNNGASSGDDNKKVDTEHLSPTSARNSGSIVSGQKRFNHSVIGKHPVSQMDPDDSLPTKLSPWTPRAWQENSDTVAGSSMTSSLALDLRLALDDMSDVDQLSQEVSGNGFQTHQQPLQRRRSGDIIVGTPPDGWSSGEQTMPVTNSEWSNGTSGPAATRTGATESEHITIASIVSGEALANIHRRVLEKYQRVNTSQQLHQSSTTPAVVSHYAKHARYVPVASNQTALLISQSEELNKGGVSNSGETESRIPLPVGKLAPIDKRLDRKLREKRNGFAKHDYVNYPVATADLPSTFEVNDAIGSDAGSNGAGRKGRLKPLIGRRAKALFTDSNFSSSSDVQKVSHLDEVQPVERGTTFTALTAVAVSRFTEDDVVVNETKLPAVSSENPSIIISVEDVPNSPIVTVGNAQPVRRDNDDNNNKRADRHHQKFNGEPFVGRPMIDEAFSFAANPSSRAVRGNDSLASQSDAFSGTVVHQDSVGMAGSVKRQTAGTTRREVKDDPGVRASGSLLKDLDASMLLVDSRSIDDDFKLQEFSLFARSAPRHHSVPNRQSVPNSTASAHRDLQGRLSDPEAPTRSRPVAIHAPATSASVNVSAASMTSAVTTGETSSKSGHVVSDGKTKLVVRDTDMSATIPRSVKQTSAVGRNSSTLPIATSTAWDPQFSLTDMWKQFQNTSKLSTGTTAANTMTGNDRIPSYMT